MNNIEKTIKHFESLQKRYVTQHNGKMCERVADALEALKSYKNEINLPCSIGDTVYYIGTECTYPECPDEWDWCTRHCDKVKNLKIKEMVVRQFRIKGNDEWNSMTDTDATYSSTEHSFYFRDIGIKVFLTKEEAEKELKRRKANEDCR